MTTLFDPIKVGGLELPNRIIMAPLTRSRAVGAGRVPNALMAEYYVQRASAGLILSEATSVTPMGVGYVDTPGIWSDEQVAGWKQVTDAVHDAGGRIFLQLWHVGRISDPLFLDGELPVAPSAIQPQGHVSLVRPVKPYVTPRALALEEIPGIVAAYRKGAENAKKAGFDGVEIHGANGYLIEQFLQSRTNLRTDQYGGSIENRARFLMEITQAVVGVWGANRVGVRLSPYGIANDSGEADPMPLYGHVVRSLDLLGLAYLHLIEPRSSGAGRAEVNHQNVPSAMVLFRPIWRGALITAGGFTGEAAEAAIADGHADAIAFGRIFISNPDLPRRLREGWPLTPYNRATFYGGDKTGYTDYPIYAELERA